MPKKQLVIETPRSKPPQPEKNEAILYISYFNILHSIDLFGLSGLNHGLIKWIRRNLLATTEHYYQYYFNLFIVSTSKFGWTKGFKRVRSLLFINERRK